MVKDHSDSERENHLLPHGLLFPISSKGSFICTISQTGEHISRPVTPVVDHWLERELEVHKESRREREKGRERDINIERKKIEG